MFGHVAYTCSSRLRPASVSWMVRRTCVRVCRSLLHGHVGTFVRCRTNFSSRRSLAFALRRNSCRTSFWFCAQSMYLASLGRPLSFAVRWMNRSAVVLHFFASRSSCVILSSRASRDIVTASIDLLAMLEIWRPLISANLLVISLAHFVGRSMASDRIVVSSCDLFPSCSCRWRSLNLRCHAVV
jgi:hypothetical protein